MLIISLNDSLKHCHLLPITCTPKQQVHMVSMARWLLITRLSLHDYALQLLAELCLSHYHTNIDQPKWQQQWDDFSKPLVVYRWILQASSFLSILQQKARCGLWNNNISVHVATNVWGRQLYSVLGKTQGLNFFAILVDSLNIAILSGVLLLHFDGWLVVKDVQ